MAKKKRNKLGGGKELKSKGQGTPNLVNILQATRVEPLNHPITLKLWPSLAKYINEDLGADFVRDAILEKLQRIVDKPTPARCSECANLDTETYDEPFCLWQCAYFFPGDKKRLNELFSCDGFKRKNLCQGI